MSSRLFQEIREKRGLVYSIYTYPVFYRDCGMFGIYAGTSPGDVNELIPVISEEISRLPATLNEKEIERAKTQLKSATLMSLESTGSRCEQIAQQILVFGRPLTIREQVQNIEAVDRDELYETAVQIFFGKPTVAAIGPVNQIKGYHQLFESFAK